MSSLFLDRRRRLEYENACAIHGRYFARVERALNASQYAVGELLARYDLHAIKVGREDYDVEP